MKKSYVVKACIDVKILSDSIKNAEKTAEEILDTISDVYTIYSSQETTS